MSISQAQTLFSGLSLPRNQNLLGKAEPKYNLIVCVGAIPTLGGLGAHTLVPGIGVARPGTSVGAPSHNALSMRLVITLS